MPPPAPPSPDSPRGAPRGTADIIDVWEAAVTFVAFPVLVWLAYYADKWKDDGWRAPPAVGIRAPISAKDSAVNTATSPATP